MEVKSEHSEEIDLSACCTASPCERERDERVLALEREVKDQHELALKMKQMIISLQTRVELLERQVACSNNTQRMSSQPYPHPVAHNSGVAAFIAKIPNTIIERKSLEDEGGEISPQSQEALPSPERDTPFQISDGLRHEQKEWLPSSNRNTGSLHRSPQATPPGTPRESLQSNRQASIDNRHEMNREGRPHSSPGKHLYARKSSAFEAVESSTKSETEQRRSRENASQHPPSRDAPAASVPSPGRGRGTRQSTPTDSGTRTTCAQVSCS